MSQFSELLREHINKKDITIKALAEKCGIDRTYLHKILKGERKVPNQAFVNNISLQLMLSAEDRSKLVELYNISEMGEDIYNRRRQVSKMIHDMANTNMEDTDVLEFKTEVDIDTVPEISIYTDKRELRKNLQVLICSDVQKGSDIQVIAQPTDYLSSLLAATAEGSESVINHLFFFDNTAGNNIPDKYNLDIFPCICHLAQKHEKYEPLYYYESASAYYNSTNIMPNIIITNNFVIRADGDYCEGVIYKSKPMVDFYMRQFDKLKSKCSKLLDHATDIFEYVYFWYDDKANFISMDFQPCTMLCLTEDIYDAHALLPAGAKEFIKEKLALGRKALLESKFINLFSEKGLAEFMATGEIFELPRNAYTYPTLAERKIMLQIMISLCESGMADYRIIKDDNFAVSKNLCLNVSENTSLNVVARNNCFSDFSYMKINETSIIQAFWDYYKYFMETDAVCSHEETIAIMRSYL